MASLLLHQPTAVADPTPLKIASIGASYAAGHGINPQINASCHRSGVNYSHQIAELLHADLADVTCSGATTVNLTKAQGNFNPPQAKILSGDHDIVLVSIGSNDIQLEQSAIGCRIEQILVPQCMLSREITDSKVPGWEDKIKNVYTQIRALEPHAKIFGISYGTPLSTANASCANSPWNQSNRQWLEHYFDLLAKYTAEGVTAVNGTYIDTSTLTLGHEICSADPWYLGSESANGDGFILHPKKKWHDALTQLLVGQIQTGK